METRDDTPRHSHGITTVTGANGHLGNTVVRALLQEKRRVRALVLGDTRSLDGLDVEQRVIDVRDAQAVEHALEGSDVVYHTAAIISLQGSKGGIVEAVNVDGTRHVVRGALRAGVRRLVHVSSFRAFEPGADHAVLDEGRAPVGSGGSAYDRSKAAAEAEIMAGVRAGLDAVIVNPTGIIGPYDFAPSRMGNFFRALTKGRMPALVEGGCNWVDVRDVAHGMIRAERHGRPGQRYLLGGTWASTRELAVCVAAQTGRAAPRLDVPLRVAGAVAPLVAFGASLLGAEPAFTQESLCSLSEHRVVSTARAREELGFQPRSLWQTISAILAWFDGTYGALAPRPE